MLVCLFSGCLLHIETVYDFDHLFFIITDISVRLWSLPRLPRVLHRWLHRGTDFGNIFTQHLSGQDWNGMERDLKTFVINGNFCFCQHRHIQYANKYENYLKSWLWMYVYVYTHTQFFNYCHSRWFMQLRSETGQLFCRNLKTWSSLRVLKPRFVALYDLYYSSPIVLLSYVFSIHIFLYFLLDLKLLLALALFLDCPL